MQTSTIRDILGGRRLHSLPGSASIGEAARLMAQNGVGAIAIIDDGRLSGIVSERDIVFRAVAHRLDPETNTVEAIMTREPVTVDIGESFSNALATKLGNVFRHLPVTENGSVVGLLTYRDIPAEYVMLFERFREMSTARADEG